MTPGRTIFRNPFARRNRSGAAAIEVALFAPVLALIVVGMVDVGYLMYQAMQLNSAVEAGALYVFKKGWIVSTGAAPIVNAMQQTGAVTGTPAALCFLGCPAGALIENVGVCGSGPTPPICAATLKSAGQYVRIDANLSTTTLVATGIFSFFGGSLALPDQLTATSTIRLP